ncbi:MAG: hypothetical protein GY816_04420 [Cytophagales bacterium]|nr:hypothetical protein [Cytophagales bacterium]
MNEIILWKVNRYAEFDEDTISLLNATNRDDEDDDSENKTCDTLEIPFSISDRILFMADRRVNKNHKLKNYWQLLLFN